MDFGDLPLAEQFLSIDENIRSPLRRPHGRFLMRLVVTASRILLLQVRDDLVREPRAEPIIAIWQRIFGFAHRLVTVR